MNRQPKWKRSSGRGAHFKEHFHEMNRPSKGSPQPAAHLRSQAYRARQPSCFPFVLESLFCSFPGIRPTNDMAQPSLCPSVIPVQQLARLCCSQNTETKQKKQNKQALESHRNPYHCAVTTGDHGPSIIWMRSGR